MKRIIVLLVWFVVAVPCWGQGKPATLGELPTAIVGASSSDVLTWLGAAVDEMSDGKAWMTGDYFPAISSQDGMGSWVDQHPGYQYYIFELPSMGGSIGMGDIHSNPGTCWVTNLDSFGLVLHEWGHSLGFDHAHSVNAPLPTYGTYPSFSNGDSSDPMSGGGIGFNAPHLECLGWVAPLFVSSDVRASLYPLSSQTGLQAITFEYPDPIEYWNHGYMFLSYRKATNIDARIPTAWLNGVSVHYGQENWVGYYPSEMRYDTFAVKVHPAEGSYVVRAGETFYFPQVRAELTVLSVGETAEIDLKFNVDSAPPPPCTPLPTEFRTVVCPVQYKSGEIIQQRTSTCPGPVWGSWMTISNTCTKKGRR